MGLKKHHPILFLFILFVLFPFQASADSGKVSFAWSPNPPEQKTINYTIYYHKKSTPDDVKKVVILVGDLVDPEKPTYSISDLEPAHWFFWITATNKHNESGPSDVVNEYFMAPISPVGWKVTFEFILRPK